MKKIYLFILIIAVLLFFNCKDDDDDNSIRSATTFNTYSGSGDQVLHVNELGEVNLTYTLSGLVNSDVYFIFTNTNPATPAQNPTITGQIYKDAPEPYRSLYTDSGPVIQMGTPEITEFNNKAFAYFKKNPSKTESSITAPQPLFDTVGQTNGFMYDSTNPATFINATCRYVTPSPIHGRTLNIWVANDCWTGGGGGKAYEVTQVMVDTLADKFLHDGTNDDILEWVTNIFGSEWENTAYSYLIGDDNNITILLYDIDNDNSTDGGVLGFFWAKDNFKATSVSYSNERIMFYIDAVLLATESGVDGWQIDDYWPQWMISTLAHEFQHMIHFYQKPVVYDLDDNSDTWINEMCSLMTEDLVSRKLGVNGPRGVVYNDPTDGSPNNTDGRLGQFNYYNDYSVTNWIYSSTISYAVNYAFGAYLGRNFGGAALFGEILNNSYTDQRALETAIASLGYSYDFGTLLRMWGASVLLSDNLNTPLNYSYNTDTWFSSVVGSITYDLGSINMYNYDYSSLSGPYLYTGPAPGQLTGHSEASNIYYLAGLDLSGSYTWNMYLGSNVMLTAVIKE